MKTMKFLAVFLSLGALVAGCGTTPDVDARFGESVMLTKAQQTANPDASRNTNPAAGMDGKAAKGAMDNYRDSFRKPPAEAPNSLTIGSGAVTSTR